MYFTLVGDKGIMVLVQITRQDKPTIVSYTNTGFPKVRPDRIEFISYKWPDYSCNYKAAFLLFNNPKWNMFTPDLHNVIGWYCRSFFSNSADLDIRIKIK
jgi:hypothetical protein